MEELVTNTDLQTAIIGAVAAVLTILALKGVELLKGAASKTENTVDDAVVAKIEEIVKEMTAKKPKATATATKK